DPAHPWQEAASPEIIEEFQPELKQIYVNNRESSATESAKGEGAVIGFASGLITSGCFGGCLITTDVLISLTGIGIIVGAPLILAGILGGFLGFDHSAGHPLLLLYDAKAPD